MAIPIEEIRSIKYFWQQRGNIERFNSWEKLIPDLQKEYPHLVKAWFDYKAAETILNLVVDSLPEYDDDE